MKLLNKIKDMLEAQYKEPIFTEAGNTDVTNFHWHKTNIDTSGNGRTIGTRPSEHPDHEHQIINFEAQPAGEDGHTHKVEA